MTSIYSKRSYHPLVSYFYFHNQLNKEQLQQIPKTTRQYWDALNTSQFFGKEWFTKNETEQLQFLIIQQQRFMRNVLKTVLKLLYCFCLLHKNSKHFKNKMKKQSDLIVSTIISIKPYVKLERICKWFSISTQQFYNWKNKQTCQSSPFRWCFKRYPFQLTPKAFNTIKTALENKVYDFLPKVSVYYDLLITKKIACSLSTFYKYANCFTHLNQTPKKATYQANKTLVASRPFEYLHLDTTLIQTINDGIQRLVVVKDNFSKAILHFAIVPSKQSKFVAQFLKDVFVMYHLESRKQIIHIVSDKGTENNGEVLAWIKTVKTSVLKKTTGVDNFLFSNNSIESVFNTFKNKFVSHVFQTKEDVHQSFNDFVYYYNCVRYPGDLYGLHPIQVLNGEPINKTKFTTAILNDKQLRYQINTAFNNCKECKS
jgi:hypothetical protein